MNNHKIKTILFLLILVASSSNIFATTYYLQNANVANASLPSSWKTDATGVGGGTAASNFTTDGDIFNTISGQSAIFATSITIGSPGGSGSGAIFNIVSGSTATINTAVVITASGKNGNSSEFNVSGTIIFGATAKISLTANNIANKFTLAAAATLKTANTTGILGTNCSVEKTGGANATATFDSGANYEFNGAANQATLGLPATVNQLTINKTGNTITLTAGTGTTTSNGLIMAAGTLNINAQNISCGSLSGSGTVTNSTNTTGTWTVTVGNANNLSSTFSGVLSNTSQTLALTKAGTGTLTLTGTNTYIGATAITAGVLNIQNNQGTGTTAGGVTVSSGAALQLQGGITVGTEALTLNGSGISGDGALRSVGTGNLTNRWGGTITLASSPVRINADVSSTLSMVTITGTNTNLFLGGLGNILVTGAITTGTGSMTDDGPGNVTFSGTNTYSGATTIAAGITSLGASNVFANNSNLVLNGGTFKTGTSTGFSDTMGTLTLNASSTFAFGGTAHTMAFTDSHLVTWAGTLITINGWTGTGGTTGTAGKIVVGTTSSGLTPGQLAKFSFSGYAPGAIQLSNGEVVPTPAPDITSATTTSSTYGTATTYTITGSDTPTNYNATGLPTGMSVNTSTGVITIAATTAAGTYSISISATNASGTGSATLSYTVIAKSLTITASNGSKTYGQTYTVGSGSTAFTSSGLQNSETIGSITLASTGAVNTAAIGSYNIVPSVATGGTFTASNYSITYTNGTLTVNAAIPTVTVTVSSYTYTGSAQGPTVATNTGTGTSYTFIYSGTGGTTYGPSTTLPTNAGSYNATATVAANGNYNSSSSAATSFTIQKAALTVTASDATKTFGTTYTLGTTAFSSNGLLSGQTIGGVTLSSAGAVSSAAIGTYPIIPSAATGGTFNAANYTITYSNGTLIVSPGTFGGTVSGSTSICAGSTAILELSGNLGNVIRWEYAISPFTTWSAITNTSTSYTTPALTETTRFRAVVQNGGGPQQNSTIAEVTIGSSTTWNGTAWSNGTPNDSNSVILSGNYTSSGTNINGCSLTVTNNAVVVISSGDAVILSGAVTVTNGSTLTFQSNANLIQSGTTNTNSGTVNFQRESALIKRLDYTLWSAPVAGQQLQAFSPQTVSNRFYTYNSISNLYDQILSPSTTFFEATKGYLIRASNYLSATVLQPWLGQFTGIPNNGNYTYTLAGATAGNRFNLIGNPYPSPIYVDEFINNANNAVSITGTLYFWRKINGATTPSYCTLTPLGGFVSNGHPAAQTLAQAYAQNPNAVIEPGQGFFVEGTGNGSGTVEFNNTMRHNTHRNLFLKTDTVERNRIWLNATNAAGAFSQTMVGYITNATQDVDEYIDGKYINDGEIALTSLIGTTPYAIQGRALPFDANDIVPISFKTVTVGDFTIAIDHTDGFFSNDQLVYLRDNITGTVHNLNSGGYTFTSEAGTFNTRFELLYQLPLAVVNPQFNDSQVVIYRDAGNNLIINTGNESMATVKIFDINGKLILEKKDIHATQISSFISLSNEVVLVQITSESGAVVTKKYLVQRTALKKDKPTLEKTQIANDD